MGGEDVVLDRHAAMFPGRAPCGQRRGARNGVRDALERGPRRRAGAPLPRRPGL